MITEDVLSQLVLDAEAAPDDPQDTAAGNGRPQDVLETTVITDPTSSPGADRQDSASTGEKPQTASYCDEALSSCAERAAAAVVNDDDDDEQNVSSSVMDVGDDSCLSLASDLPAEQHAHLQCEESFKNPALTGTHLEIHAREAGSVAAAAAANSGAAVSNVPVIGSGTTDEFCTTQCAICGKRFERRSHVVTHMRTHTKPFTCDVCQHRFSTGVQLKAHTVIHSGEKPHECDICGARFAWKRSIVLHKRRHTGEKPYMCTFCGRAFTQYNVLVNHLRTHTGEKPHHCDTCGKGFSYITSLQLHLLKHTGEKPFECSVCQRRFAQASTCRGHMERIHSTSYNCFLLLTAL